MNSTLPIPPKRTAFDDQMNQSQNHKNEQVEGK